MKTDNKTKAIQKVPGRPRKVISLNKTQEKELLRLFSGTKTEKGIKDGRKIAEKMNLPRRVVMETLMSKGLRKYSPGSFTSAKK